MTRDVHSYLLRNSGARGIPDRTVTRIVKQFPFEADSRAALLPHLRGHGAQPRRALPPDSVAHELVEARRTRAPVGQRYLAQFAGHRHDAGFAVLRFALAQMDLVFEEVDLTPPQRADFSDTYAGPKPHCERSFEVVRQYAEKRTVVVDAEEARPGVPLGTLAEVRNLMNLPGALRQPEHPLNCGATPVDTGR